MKGALSWPFLRLYGLTILYFCANAILNVLIPLKGDSMGASNSEIGIIMGAYLFTTMFFRPWAGHIIRQKGPVQVLRAIILINGLALLLYTFTGLQGYFIARVLQGACTAFFSMALQLGIIDALPEKERSQGVSLYSLFASIPNVIGPLLAVGIWQNGEMTYFTWTIVAIVILTGVAGFSIQISDSRESDPKSEGEKETFFNPSAICTVILIYSDAVSSCLSYPSYLEQLPPSFLYMRLRLTSARLPSLRYRRVPLSQLDSY